MLPGSRHRTADLSACCFFFFFDLALENPSSERPPMISRQVNKTSQRLLIFDCTVKLLSGKRIETRARSDVGRGKRQCFFKGGYLRDQLTDILTANRGGLSIEKTSGVRPAAGRG